MEQKQKIEYDNLEITRLTAKIDVLKSYYSALIGKNMAKIESVVEDLDRAVKGYIEEDPTIGFKKDIETLLKKEQKAKLKIKKDSYRKEIEYLRTIISMLENRNEENKKYWYLLRQVM